MWFSFKKNKLFSLNLKSGFTLVEMLVVLAIFVVVTGIILANLPDFKSSTNLDLVAQQVALYVRGAQVYAVGSVYQATGQQFPTYGIYFNNNAGGFLGNNSFLLFGDSVADGAGDNFYTSTDCTPGSGECLERYKLPNGYTVSAIKSCVGTSCTSRNSLAIVFKRPESQAYFYCGANTLCEGAEMAEITLHSSRDDRTRIVSVMKSGQIAVNNK